MKKPILLTPLLLLIIASAAIFSRNWPAGILQKSLNEIFGKSEEIAWQTFPISGETRTNLLTKIKQKAFVPDTLWIGEMTAANEKNFVIIHEAFGKAENFTFAVYISETGNIIDVDVLVYREDYGGEIDHPAFRKQFRGKSKSKQLIFGRSIQGITGATISARAITYGVRDVLTMFKFFQPQLQTKE